MRLLWLTLLIAAVTATYANHFGNGFHFDDWHTVQQNAYITDLRYVPRFFTDTSTFSCLPDHQSYRPLLPLTLAVDYRLGNGLVPFWFQLDTFLFFVLQLVGMVLLFTRLIGWGPALFVTAWYGLHPVNAETVNYVIQRGDVYSTCGVVWGLYLYVRKSRLYLVPVALGILAKPLALVFAPILTVYAARYEDRPLRRSLPAWVVCVALYLLQAKMTGQHNFGGTALGPHLRTQPWIALHYVKSLFLPTELSADTDWGTLSLWQTETWVGFLFVAALVVVAVRTSRPALSLGLAWFLLALAPTSLVPLSEVTNDHRMFFPYVGLMLAAGELLRPLGRRWVIPGVLLLACYAYGTTVRNEVWRTEETLWKDVTVKSPRNGRGWMNYGLALMERGDFAGARDCFLKGRELTPNYELMEINLGLALDRLQSPEARAHFQRALELSPQSALAHFYYGEFLARHGEPAEAELRQAVALSPDDMRFRHLLLKVLWEGGEPIEELARETLRRMPSDPVAQRYLADQHSADEYLDRSLALYNRKQYAMSAQAAQAVLRLDPRSARAYNNLAAAQTALGRYPEAIEAARKALAIDPDFALARANLEQARRLTDLIRPHLAEPSPTPPPAGP